MFPTALIYSSHNRSELIHRWWIVERALRSPENKTILYLPFSMGEMHQQEYSWGTFRWYFDQFRKWGLEPRNFYWREDLAPQDVELLFHWIETSQVVILGGGNTELGMERYRGLGRDYFGNPHLFGEILRRRQERGMLTAGFSAGADQLCSFVISVLDDHLPDPFGFGLAYNVMTTLHHEWGREGRIAEAARRFPHFMVFGLPNDSGLAVDQGRLPSGNIWQIIEFIIDTTWDLPQDAWHIKTRSGMKIEHYYADGRHWSFQGGDRIVRVIAPNFLEYDAWFLPAHGGGIYHYGTQRPSGYSSVEEILAHH
ncbi:MAG: hypothetical protein D6795_04780 [Deltaproteobacteria bacterium]|nr:MAG: hypothetical protein D6795_04780 [Deltaproteobacteria bacterium]